ncbi:MAG: CHAT domain-containing protein [bacterium]|nr:CHAT domain-containing protein [bacterium]
MKKTFMAKVYEQYEETAAFMLDNKYHNKAFKHAEAMRGRVFLDHMAEGLVKLEKGMAPEMIQKRDNLVAKLSIISKEISNAAGKNDEKKLKELKEEYQRVENQFEELLIKIRLNNPLYAAVRYPQPITVKDLQKNVLEKDDLLLRYFISRDNIHVFFVSKTDFKVFPLDVKEDDIHKIAAEYLFAVEEKNTRGVKNYGKQLYRKLFKPLEPAIKDRKEIIIIPDGELAKIPFESLVIENKKPNQPVYLLEKYRVKYVQSASILAILRKHYQRKGTSKRFIGFGDPVYDYQNFKQGKTEIGTPTQLTQGTISGMHRGRYEQEGGLFTRLESSSEEVDSIARLFKAHSQNTVVNLRENASETNAKSPGINQFDYIHFACHAILGDGFQSLVLSQLPENTDDGFLTLNEIMNCDYNAKLVVLSACRTGKGKMERGEGVTGLTRAVMYAGTPAVVASLWDVDDVATKELMVRFYKYMLEDELDKETALRKAKLDLIKSKKYSSPFYWSAFVMYGE